MIEPLRRNYQDVTASPLLAAAVFVLSAFALTAQTSLPVRSGIITARIEADKSAYRLGEPIQLRLSLTNITRRTIYVVDDEPPYWNSDLQVFDADGKRLSPTRGRGRCICEGRTSTVPLNPGKSVVYEYNDPYSRGALREWADLSRWGYELPKPGGYTLRAVARVRAIQTGGAEFETSSAVSSLVHIAIAR